MPIFLSFFLTGVSSSAFLDISQFFEQQPTYTLHLLAQCFDASSPIRRLENKWKRWGESDIRRSKTSWIPSCPVDVYQCSTIKEIVSKQNSEFQMNYCVMHSCNRNIESAHKRLYNAVRWHALLSNVVQWAFGLRRHRKDCASFQAKSVVPGICGLVNSAHGAPFGNVQNNLYFHLETT